MFIQKSLLHAVLRCINYKLLLRPIDKEFIHTSLQRSTNCLFRLSDIGEGIREVQIKEWYVNVGDKIAQFDNVCEVQSDKASVTITSRYDGIVKKLYYNIDDTALVGEPLIDIETDDINDGLDQNGQIESKSSIDNNLNYVASKVSANNDVQCIPSVRRLAKEYQVNLSEIKPTGKGSRIIKEDVLNYLKLKNEQNVNESKVSNTINDEMISRSVPLSSYQKAMMKTMTAALAIPQLVYGDEIIVTNLVALRKQLNVELLSREKQKLTYTPFFVKAISNALVHHPILNSFLDTNNQSIVYMNNHNIAIAMHTKLGLVVPVIRNVQKLNVREINNELNRLLSLGINGKLSVDDLNGATITLSNIGAIGGTYMTPIIMPPQVAIIALGSIQLIPRINYENQIRHEQIVHISATADHRLIDGATMAQFVRDFKIQLQASHLLLL